MRPLPPFPVAPSFLPSPTVPPGIDPCTWAPNPVAWDDATQSSVTEQCCLPLGNHLPAPRCSYLSSTSPVAPRAPGGRRGLMWWPPPVNLCLPPARPLPSGVFLPPWATPPCVGAPLLTGAPLYAYPYFHPSRETRGSCCPSYAVTRCFRPDSLWIRHYSPIAQAVP
jgi:hypothetical protein